MTGKLGKAHLHNARITLRLLPQTWTANKSAGAGRLFFITRCLGAALVGLENSRRKARWNSELLLRSTRDAEVGCGCGLCCSVFSWEWRLCSVCHQRRDSEANPICECAGRARQSSPTSQDSRLQTRAAPPLRKKVLDRLALRTSTYAADTQARKSPLQPLQTSNCVKKLKTKQKTNETLEFSNFRSFSWSFDASSKKKQKTLNLLVNLRICVEKPKNP